MKINKKALFLILLFFMILPVIIYAAEGDQGTTDMIENIKTAALTIGTAVVVIGWIIAGILWLTSGGSPEKTGTAKKATVAAAIGTIVIILAPFAYATVYMLLNAGK